MPREPNLARLIAAIRVSDLGTVRALVAADPALLRAHDPDCFGATPLIHATGVEDFAMVDLLLDLGADIDQRSDWHAGGFSALDGVSDDMADHLLRRGATLIPHAAAALGRLDDLRAMLDADPALVHARGGDGQFPLHYARTAEVADLLLSRGAEIDGLDIDHAGTAAQWLCTKSPPVAAHLVGRGAAADPFLAASTGDTGLLERLLAGEPEGVGLRVSRRRFPASPPAAGHIYLYTIGEGGTLLHAAAGANSAVAVRWLAARGADPNARGGYDHGTPLHAAAWADSPEAALALLDAGADIDTPSGPAHRNEPLGWAIVGGSVNTCRVLLERSAAIRPHHFDDARAGSQGRFRAFKHHRPLSAWQEIERLLERPMDRAPG